MGKISKGILGGFSGTVGSVVGSTWKGIDVIRSKPKMRKKSSTKSQVAQRKKFGAAVKFFSSIHDMVKIGFQEVAIHQTAHNVAIKENFKHFSYDAQKDEIKIDYSKLIIANGSRPPVRNFSVTKSSDNSLSFDWKYDSFERGTHDPMLNLLFISENGEILPRYDFDLLVAENTTINSDELGISGTVHVYCFYHHINVEGKLQVSDSVHALVNL
ncbi:hypothetical protein K4L44_06760 [Halosquirtibacter laminarini]|uniref:Uncharacterized protein n=1 Tax=Halosquirtibacter laminarini TaxID=3374600 RepID=A0AC61NP48_9BACT|nr:hypothetical protein K4L44_06760 [Prolixibacteraceae bacterium]